MAPQWSDLNCGGIRRLKDVLRPVTLKVRSATEVDLDEVTRMFADYLRFYEVEYPVSRVRSFLWERITMADSVIIVAAEDGVAVGFAQVYPTYSSLELSSAWVLNDLYVAEGGRRSGVGRALVAAVCERAGAAGAAYVTLETARSNEAARSLYESAGFITEEAFLHYVKRTVGQCGTY